MILTLVETNSNKKGEHPALPFLIRFISVLIFLQESNNF